MLTPVAKFKTACWTCRKRKIKCAKIQPCRNCTIAGIACSYPPQVRTVRRPKKATSRSVSNDKSGADIFDRVGRLEALLNDRPQFPQMDGVGDGVFDPQKFPYEQLQDQAGGTHGMTPTSASGQPHPSPSSTNASASHQEDTDEDQDEDDEYWKKLEEECAGKVFLKTPTSVGGTMASSFHVSSFDKPKPESSPNGFPLNLSPTTLRAPLLSVTQRRVCLHRYLENVDPILKILHKPALENLMSMSDRNTPMLCASARVLIQAVCLLSITSMSEEEVLVNFENDKQWMLEKCAASTEQALVEANFLVADDLRTLQALLLFLYYLRYKGDPRLNALSGATISLASQMKLNRDGTALGLSRLEVELRRRLWWQLVNLVDHPDNSTLGCSPLSGIAADTELPSNINDFELERQDAPLGEKHGGFTDFSFCLMQYEITRAFNQIKSESSAHRDANACGAEKRLHSVREILELKYFRDETTDLPIRRFAADVVAMILAKRRILMYISLDEENGGGSLPPRTRDHLFLLGIHVLELSRRLQTNETVKRWRWLSTTYFQWSVATYVVRELMSRPLSQATRRAWHAIDGIWDDWPEGTRSSPRALVLSGLIEEALRRREAQQRSRSLDLSMPLAAETFTQMMHTPSIPQQQQRRPTAEGRRGNNMEWMANPGLGMLEHPSLPPAYPSFDINSFVDSWASMDEGLFPWGS